jgi:nucleoporin NUP42
VKATYRPGITPYDSQLPPNYVEMVPSVAVEAFKSKKFEWGKIPEWVPPIEFR